MHSGTVLVIDDNKTNRQLLRTMLEEEGYTVETAASGAEALAFLSGACTDIILLDIVMPEMDGFETCSRIKDMPKKSDIPVIFISSQEELSEKVKAFSVGGVDYIIKPFRSAEVLARIQTHIKLFRLQRSLQEKNRELEESKRTIERQQHEMAMQSRAATMGEILSLIAHHWRQPLSVISTIATNVLFKQQLGMLDETTVTETQNQIIRHAQSLSEIIDSFRDFFKPDRIVQTTLRSVLSKASTLTSSPQKEYKTTLVIEENDALDTPLSTYENELIQVIVGIMLNAMEAFQRNSVTAERVIRIASTGHKGEIAINILDNAGGIPAEKLGEIFLPYYSTKEKQVGTGLGLYMARMVIEKHCQGHITAVNSDEGALFSITIPLSVTSAH